MRNRIFWLLGFTASAMLAGCASSHVLIGQARPAISPEQVKLYVRAPAKYEEIAILEASSKASWAISDQGKMNKVIERLKEEAAELGANGVMLTGAGDQYAGAVNSGSATAAGGYAYGTGVAVPVIHKAGSGLAIFVIEN